MIEIPSLRLESRYGIPSADQLLFNREYIVGYSYLLRQAAWAMELVDPHTRRVDVKRNDSFRTDLRIPEAFRAELVDFQGSGFDRGHLIASAGKRSDRVRNSETFLLSNMSPQKPNFNRGVWKKLEKAVRDLSHLYIETYVVCGPLFNVGSRIKVIGENNNDPNDIIIPIPHGFFKSVLAEDKRGRLKLWSFIIENRQSGADLDTFLCKTTDIERQAGLSLWDRLRGDKFDRLKHRTGNMWDEEKAKDAAKAAKDKALDPAESN